MLLYSKLIIKFVNKNNASCRNPELIAIQFSRVGRQTAPTIATVVCAHSGYHQSSRVIGIYVREQNIHWDVVVIYWPRPYRVIESTILIWYPNLKPLPEKERTCVYGNSVHSLVNTELVSAHDVI